MKKSNITLAVAATLLFSCAAQAYEKGDILLRVGLTTVAPDESSSNIALAGADLGFGLSVDNNTQVGLNLAYFLTNNLNVELLAATPFTHDIQVNDNPLGLTKLGEATHLPPTLTLNYFFNNSGAAFQPYIGAGLNYTLFFDEEFTDTNEGIGFSDLDLDASFGYSIQAGFDYAVDTHWLINASVRYIDISTDASFTLNNSDLGANNAPGAVTVDIDPYVYTLSVAYKF
ncbi:OmpW/AlkL family protein [Agaribacter flavus]|uniref:OmpW family protein n=1 Tax=Agaribacter flavus TaxID=1902781 RepID=A0ABV7FS67_9ALTE